LLLPAAAAQVETQVLLRIRDRHVTGSAVVLVVHGRVENIQVHEFLPATWFRTMAAFA
jgi:hypothetical protein